MLLSLQYSKQALMNANILLFSLNHPNSFFPHFINDSEDVNYIILPYALKDSVQCDECSRSAHTSTTVNHNRSLLRTNSLAESAYEAHKGLWGFGNTKIWPRGEVEVANVPDSVPSHHPELAAVPVGEVALIQNSHLNVSVVDGFGVVRPVVIALLPSFLNASGQHHYGSGVGFPAHSPEVVSGGVKGALSDNKFPL